METKRIFDFKLMQYLIERGHNVVRIDDDKKDPKRKIFVFEKTEGFMKDFINRTYEKRKIALQ